METNRILIIILLLLGGNNACNTICAQSIDDFNKYTKQIEKDFKVYKATRETEFNRYREQYNREFAEHLRKSWKLVNPQKKIVPPPQPKPFVPKLDNDNKPQPITPKELPIKEVVTPKPVPPAPEPIVIDEPQEDEAQKNGFTVGIGNFYGDNIMLKCNPDASITLDSNTPSAIATAWEQLSRGDWDLLIYGCQQIRKEHNYCDWMYYQFVRQIARTATKTTNYSHASVLLAGYILAHSGIDFRLASSEHELFLALPFDTKIFNCTYFIVDGRCYYVVEKELDTACVLMNHKFSKEAASLALRYTTPMHWEGTEHKEIELVSEKYPMMKVSISSNQSLMEFYHSYPRMDWQEYVFAPIEDRDAESTVKLLSVILERESDTEKANMLLNFVQTAFTYGYDDQIWGYDRPFFPHETLNYPQSDCEDRSILFAYLIRKLTDLDIVLLYYPNHLATAIRFNEDIQGDYVLVNGQKYFVCDPTGYKPIGHAYDEFKNVQADVIKIE